MVLGNAPHRVGRPPRGRGGRRPDLERLGAEDGRSGPGSGHPARCDQREPDRAEQQKQALEEATERVPHLAHETIRLILAASPTSVLDPPEVFYFACEAADRGHAALTPAEAQQLNALRADLLAALRPSERARLREYDATRARRFVFPFENGDVLELFARGV